MHPTLPYLFLCLFLAIEVRAQDDSTYRAAEPALSAHEIAQSLVYRQWTEEQSTHLLGIYARLEFAIDPYGIPALASVTNVDRLDVLDSLRSATAELPNFTPALRDGTPVAGSYSLWLSFPGHGVGTEEFFYRGVFFGEDDRAPLTADSLRARYTRINNRGFIDFNGSYVHHYGEVGTYLKDGGGFDIILGSNWNDRWGAGLLLAFEITGRHRPFPEDRFPDRNRETSGGLGVGGMLAFHPYTSDRLTVSLRPEAGYGLLNAANRLDPDEEEGLVQYRGGHFGLTAQASFRVGSYRPQLNYGTEETTATYSAINAFAGIRHRYYGDRVGTGTFLVAGVGYRFGSSVWVRRQ
jgi:hypothetical protein